MRSCDSILIAAMLLDPDIIPGVCVMASREDFRDPNDLIFDIICDLHSAGSAVDIIAVYNEVIERGLEDRIRACYLMDLVARRQIQDFRWRKFRLIQGGIKDA